MCMSHVIAGFKDALEHATGLTESAHLDWQYVVRTSESISTGDVLLSPKIKHVCLPHAHIMQMVPLPYLLIARVRQLAEPKCSKQALRFP